MDDGLHGDMVRIESAVGTSPQDAKVYADAVEGEVKSGLRYPLPPTPEPAEPDYITAALDSFLKKRSRGNGRGSWLGSKPEAYAYLLRMATLH